MLELPESFIVGTNLRLPGLGLLLLPAAPEPSWLITYDLHTTLLVTLPDEQPITVVTGTIEEIEHSNQAPQRGLLLDFDPVIPIRSGSKLIIDKVFPDLH